ncbi:MAG: hypothetical protein IPK16_30120 [Anaerolineales bacterium]|nr:hypothetical protein [Anaerolineales bacterium]
MGVLSGEQLESFQKALIDAYKYESLERMLRYRMQTHDGKPMRLDLYVKETDFPHQVFQLIEKAEMQGWTYRLLAAAQLQSGQPRIAGLCRVSGADGNGRTGREAHVGKHRPGRQRVPGRGDVPYPPGVGRNRSLPPQA